MSQKIFLILLFFKLTSGDESENEFSSFLSKYKVGVGAYLANDYKYCEIMIEEALNEFHEYYDAVVTCNMECEFKETRTKPFFNEDIEDLHFYEKFIRKTLCIRQCHKIRIPEYSEFFVMDNWSKSLFLNRQPYTYLHICNYKRDELEKAIQAAYTYLIIHPNDKMMKDNLMFYLSNDNANYSMIKDLEEKRFVKFYLNGVDAYNNEDYAKCIENMEESINLYIRAIDECRAFCEGEFDHGWHPDFTTSVSNHYTFCLRCKNNCTALANIIEGTYYDDLLAKHYDYLQFSYYQVGKLNEAVNSAMSYLLFHPNAEEMLSNIQFYKDQNNFNEEYLKPRKEAENFVLRDKYENKLLTFIDTEFVKLMDDEDPGEDVKGIETQVYKDPNFKGFCPANNLISIFLTKPNKKSE